MTPQKQEQANPMFHYFQMEDLVPEDHILRQIDEAVDFSFVRDVASDCYCPDNGRPGIDPELVVRMILIGYLYNLSRESALSGSGDACGISVVLSCRHLMMRFRIGARSTSFAITSGHPVGCLNG